MSSTWETTSIRRRACLVGRPTRSSEGRVFVLEGVVAVRADGDDLADAVFARTGPGSPGPGSGRGIRSPGGGRSRRSISPRRRGCRTSRPPLCRRRTMACGDVPSRRRRRRRCSPPRGGIRRRATSARVGDLERPRPSRPASRIRCPTGLEFVSRFRNKALSSAGNLLSMRTRLRRAPTILRDVLDLHRADVHAGAAGRAGPDLALGLDVPGRAAAGRSRFCPEPAARRRRAGRFSMLKRIILGERGLSEAKAGQASWQRPHSMQAKASRLSFQVKVRELSPAPKTSDSSRSRAGELAAAARPAEEHVERSGEHVQVLGMGNVGDEAVDGDDVRPPGDLMRGRGGRGSRPATPGRPRRASGRGTPAPPAPGWAATAKTSKER